MTTTTRKGRGVTLAESPPATGQRIVIPDLPLPPTLNNAYTRGAGHGRRILTKEAGQFKAAAALQIRNAAALQGVTVPPKRWLAVDITFVFAANNRDGDNAVKLLADAAAEALGFDDRYVQRMAWRKLINPRAPRCDLVIEVL